MMARRVSADWAHKCWAPVLAAAAAVSGPDTRSSGKYDAKLSTQPRARGLIMMGGAPGPVTGGRENHPETVRVQSDRVTNYFCRHRKLFYTAPSKFL